MLAQDVLKQDPFSGAVFCLRGRRGDLVKILYWDGQGFCPFAKRLEKGRFTWPNTKEGSATLTAAQLSRRKRAAPGWQQRHRGALLRAGALSAPPAALYRYTRYRKGEHCGAQLAGFTGRLHADGYAGFGKLYEIGGARLGTALLVQGPPRVAEVACWAHTRRGFFALATWQGERALPQGRACLLRKAWAQR